MGQGSSPPPATQLAEMAENLAVSAFFIAYRLTITLILFHYTVQNTTMRNKKPYYGIADATPDDSKSAETFEGFRPPPDLLN